MGAAIAHIRPVGLLFHGARSEKCVFPGAAVLLRQLQESRQGSKAASQGRPAILISQDENQARYARRAGFRGSPRGLFAHLPHPFVCGFVASLPDARAVPSNPESSCKAASGGCHLCLGPSHEKTSSIGLEPSGISVRILFEGSLRLIVVRDGEGRTDRPCRRVDV